LSSFFATALTAGFVDFGEAFFDSAVFTSFFATVFFALTGAFFEAADFLGVAFFLAVAILFG
jgi:hypothetical protein